MNPAAVLPPPLAPLSTGYQPASLPCGHCPALQRAQPTKFIGAPLPALASAMPTPVATLLSVP